MRVNQWSIVLTDRFKIDIDKSLLIIPKLLILTSTCEFPDSGYKILLAKSSLSPPPFIVRSTLCYHRHFPCKCHSVIPVQPSYDRYHALKVPSRSSERRATCNQSAPTSSINCYLLVRYKYVTCVSCYKYTNWSTLAISRALNGEWTSYLFVVKEIGYQV